MYGLSFFQRKIKLWLITIACIVSACFPVDSKVASTSTQENLPTNQPTMETVCFPDSDDNILNSQAKGYLLFGKNSPSGTGYSAIYSLNLLSKEIKTVIAPDENAIYQSLSVSQQGDMFSVIKLDRIDHITLEIFSSKGERIKIIPWNYEAWWGHAGWRNSGIVVFPILRKNEVNIIDPYSDVEQVVNIGFDDSNYEIRGVDPLVTQFLLRNPDDFSPNLYDTSIIWDMTRKTVIWRDDDKTQKIREVSWSNDGEQIAVVSGQNDIFILDRHGNVLHKLYVPIQIYAMGVQWSLDEKEIYFWGKDLEQEKFRKLDETFKDTGIFLYSYDLSTKTLKRYCYSSLYSDLTDRPKLIQIYPNNFIVENATSYNWSLGIYKFELRLIDTSSEKSFLLGNDLEMIGWLPYAP